jgi:hypothetical protein
MTTEPASNRAASTPDTSTKTIRQRLSDRPDRFILVAYAVVAVGVFLGWGAWKLSDPEAFTPPDGISIFAVLFIFAQAIERGLEPLTNYAGNLADGLDTHGKAKERDELIAKGKKVKAVRKQMEIDQARQDRAVVVWAVASVVAMLGCGALGIMLLALVGAKGVPVWVDIAITGLVIASGTKPLHDLVSYVQKSKELQATTAKLA